MRFWSTTRGLLALGLLAGAVAAVLAASGNPGNMAICVACFVRDSAGALGLHQAAPVQYLRPEIPGILLGALAASMLAGEYRTTGGSSTALRFGLGAVMVTGALVFLGCPTRMFIRMSSGDLSAWIGLVGFVAGIATGSVFVRRGFSLGRAYPTRRGSGLVLPVAALGALLASVTTLALAASTKGPGSIHAPVAVSLAGGLLFGALAQRSRMCWAGSFRNMFLARSFSTAMPILGFFLAMLVFNVATGRFSVQSFGPIAHPQHLWNILGLYVVGLAAVLLGGCPLRQLVLAGSGNNDSAVTVLGMLVGAAFAHTFGFASAAAAPATAATPAAAGGPGVTGQVATLVCIAILLAVGVLGTRRSSAAAEPAPSAAPAAV